MVKINQFFTVITPPDIISWGYVKDRCVVSIINWLNKNDSAGDGLVPRPAMFDTLPYLIMVTLNDHHFQNEHLKSLIGRHICIPFS